MSAVPPIDAFRPYDRALARLSRRAWLDAAWKLGAGALAPILAPARLGAQPVFRRYPFSLGVASGDPAADGVVLWTRLAPEPLDGGGMPAAAVEVGWEVAKDETFRDIVGQGTTTARPELGHSVHVEVAGLSPGREYWYRFHCGREVSQTGRTLTAPAQSAAVDRLRFGVCGCSHYEHGFFTAYRRLAEEHFDFVFHTGDYIYEGRADGGRTPGRVRQHHGEELYTLVDYRNRYAQYRLDPDLQAAHRSAPFIVTWDDHEVANDYAADADERDTPPALFLLRRAAAYQAYFEAMPLRAASLPRGPFLQLYRRLRFGTLLDLSVLDTRQFRAKQACGGGTAPQCPEALDPARGILGAEQERWLFDTLVSTRATWTVLGQQVPTFARDSRAVSPETPFAMDKWDGYVAARDRLYRRFLDARTPNPVLLSGDVHLHYGANLKQRFDDPRSPTVGVELTNTSIASGGDGADVSPTWDQVRGDNPHILYHSARRGYIACTATPKTLTADFRILHGVTTPGEPATSGGRLIVEAGVPGAERA